MSLSICKAAFRSLQSKPGGTLARQMCSAATTYNYETINVLKPCDYVLNVEINRPEKRNAITTQLLQEMFDCFKKINEDKDCRAVVISGAGKMFCAGIDLTELGEMAAVFQSSDDLVRKATQFYTKIKYFQDTLSSIEKCSKPVIGAIHDGCIGAGFDLITSCDIRYCTSNAYFQIKEVEMGLAADVGTLQRLPKIVGNHSFIREMIYTARKFGAEECKEFDIVSKISSDKDAMMKKAMETASEIANKSPVAVQGSKLNVLYSRDHSVDDSLEFMARWNMYALQSEDLMKAAMAAISKSGPPDFSKL